MENENQNVVEPQKPEVQFEEKKVVIPEEYKPISMWGYFGYELLFSIPCVGFIVLLVFAFGGNKNINVRNFARSYFCYFIIVAIITLIVVLVAGVGIFSFGAFSNYRG